MAERISLRNRKLSSEVSAGSGVVVAGWVQETRNLGGISFIQLRDREGITQITLLKKKMDEELFKEITTIPRESVVAFKGEVKENAQAKSGFELLPDAYELLSEAETPLPLGVVDKVGADLDTRLNNRFLDLRKVDILDIFKIRDIILRENGSFIKD